MRLHVLLCLVAIGGCKMGSDDDPSASLAKDIAGHLHKRLGTLVTVECPELPDDGTFECSGHTEAGAAFTVEMILDADRWVRGDLRGVASGADAAGTIRANYQTRYGLDVTSLHCPDILVEGTAATCRAHADTQGFDITATVHGSRIDHETDGLILMSDVEATGAALFGDRGTDGAIVDCGRPRARVKRPGERFSCSAVVAGQSAFVDVTIGVDGPTLAISGWQQ